MKRNWKALTARFSANITKLHSNSSNEKHMARETCIPYHSW